VTVRLDECDFLIGYGSVSLFCLPVHGQMAFHTCSSRYRARLFSVLQGLQGLQGLLTVSSGKIQRQVLVPRRSPVEILCRVSSTFSRADAAMGRRVGEIVEPLWRLATDISLTDSAGETALH
jgi:hypothetical protein